MKTVAHERIIPVDVDETLIIHENPLSYSRYVDVEDPLEAGKFITLGVNEPMVKILKDESLRGAFIIVWSRSGHQWAEAIVKALNLSYYVNIVMTKPQVYLDDKEVSEWLKDRIYLNPKVIYKQHNNTKEKL